MCASASDRNDTVRHMRTYIEAGRCMGTGGDGRYNSANAGQRTSEAVFLLRIGVRQFEEISDMQKRFDGDVRKC